MHKLNIVKFKNGKYGVRRSSWLSDYTFAVNHTGILRIKSNDLVQEFKTKEEALRVMDSIIKVESIDNDKGEVIND